MVLTVLVGAVIVPAVLSLSVGIVALSLWREGFDIALGVLVLCFAAMSIVGGVAALASVRRSARLADLQSEFVSNVSHELRTPLAGIRLMAETLSTGRAETPESRREVLDRLEVEVARLEELVERILRWRQLENGGATASARLVHMGRVVREAARRYDHPAGRQAVTVDVSIDPGLPPVWGDPEGLLDAVGNLVHNAVKFGGERGPVEVVARQRGDDVVVEVRDEGPGIPAREKSRILERFYRAPVHRRSQQGTGIGLSIVQTVVRQHGGKLRIESEPGIGSAFILHLPVADLSEIKGESWRDGADDGALVGRGPGGGDRASRDPETTPREAEEAT